jgi:methyl-accepting chemotaxis protein
VITTLNVAADCTDRISKGDVPGPILEAYRGDFNQLKSDLNTLIEATNEITQVADKISRGDLTGSIQERSPRDKLMQASPAFPITAQGSPFL